MKERVRADLHAWSDDAAEVLPFGETQSRSVVAVPKSDDDDILLLIFSYAAMALTIRSAPTSSGFS